MKINSLVALTLLSIFIYSCKKDTIATENQHPAILAVNFTISSDSVVLDPYGVAPLSALVSFTSPLPGSTLIIVRGKNGRASDIQHLFSDSGYSHSVPVIGLYANYVNTVDIYTMSNKGDTLAESTVSITTNPLPTNFVTNIISLDVPMATNTTPGLNLVNNLTSNDPQIPFMVDNFGDIRWMLNYKNHPPLDSLDYECGLKRLRNGNFFFADDYSNAIYEVNLLGKIVNIWPLAASGYWFHHDIIEMPNGNFLSTAHNFKSTNANGVSTIGDFVIEIDRVTGALDDVWDLKVSLDDSRTVLSTNASDWFHGNGLVYDSTDNTIIVSGRVQGVVKLDFKNNVKWILGPHEGWGTNGLGQDLNQFLLTPLDASGNIITDSNVVNGFTNAADFEWNWYQHCPSLIPNGDLMLFDDGTTRNFDTSSTQPLYSRAVEYKIDPVNMTVQQIWEYGKERGIDTYSAIVSSVQYLPSTNHVMFCPGYSVVNSTGLGGKIIEVDYATRQVVSELSLSSLASTGFHRAYRIDAYPN